VVRMWLGEYDSGPNEGKPFFMAMASVHEPQQFSGAFTQLGPEALCDTPPKPGALKSDFLRYTKEEHIAEVGNYLRMFEIDTSTAPDDDDELTEWLNEKFAIIVNRGPFVMFSTSAKKAPKNPDGTPKKGPDGKPLTATGRPYHNWHKEVEYIPTVPEGQEVDKTGKTPPKTAAKATTSANGASKKPGINRLTGASNKTQVQTEEPDDDIQGDTPDNSVDETEPNYESMTLDQLAEMAVDKTLESGQNAKAQEELSSRAEDAGLSVKKGSPFDKSPSWADAVKMIKKAQKNKPPPDEEPEEPTEEPQEEQAEEPEEEGIQTGQVYKYREIYVKEGKRFKSKRPTDVQVLKVDTTKQTVTLKNLIDGKTILGADKKPLQVKWTELEPS
jgi:hypothetical protein